MKIRLIRDDKHPDIRQDEVIEYSVKLAERPGERIIVPQARPEIDVSHEARQSKPSRHVHLEYEFRRRDENGIPVYVWVGYL